ncbi:hypothetical protein [Alloactinosynnema sp. L-07]|nr:hypothetical protein [Alloactinosynnema sp. L-07]
MTVAWTHGRWTQARGRRTAYPAWTFLKVDSEAPGLRQPTLSYFDSDRHSAM